MPLTRVGLHLPYVYPPKGAVLLPGGRIHSVSDDEVETEFGDQLTGDALSGWEINILFRKRNPADRHGKRNWTVFERSSAAPSDESILALLDLLTGDWRHRLRVPSPSSMIRGATMPKAIRMRRLTQGLTNKLRKAMQFAGANRRLEIGLNRWRSSYRRDGYIESVLDCCSALEAIISIEQELRLRLSLSVGDIVPSRKRAARRTVYRLYGMRNKFVHGSSIPSVSNEERNEFIAITAAVLRQVVVAGHLPKQLEEGQLLSV